MTSALFVFIGGGFGSLLRFALALADRAWLGTAFPAGTLAANLLGSFLLGFLARYSLNLHGVSTEVRLGLTTGLCGGFTTYSTFNLETLHLFEQGRVSLAALYVVATLALCIGGGLAGFALARALG